MDLVAELMHFLHRAVSSHGHRRSLTGSEGGVSNASVETTRTSTAAASGAQSSAGQVDVDKARQGLEKGDQDGSQANSVEGRAAEIPHVQMLQSRRRSLTLDQEGQEGKKRSFIPNQRRESLTIDVDGSGPDRLAQRSGDVSPKHSSDLMGRDDSRTRKDLARQSSKVGMSNEKKQVRCRRHHFLLDGSVHIYKLQRLFALYFRCTF